MKLPYDVSEEIVLAVDIGGTNTSCALMHAKSRCFEVLLTNRYSTKKEPSLNAILTGFLKEAKEKNIKQPAACCISAAGPLEEGKIRLTNASWTINAKEIEKEICIPVKLINDFSAIAWGVMLLDHKNPQELIQLPRRDGILAEANEKSPIVVIGAGTGLGYGFVLRDGGKTRVYPSEGGHITLPVYDDETRALSCWLGEHYGFAAGTEAAVSGPGLSNIFEFVANSIIHDNKLTQETKKLTEEILKIEEPQRPAAIAKGAEEGLISCKRTIDIFVKLYARAASDAASIFLPGGGIFLAGGIAGKNISWFIENFRFMDSFLKGYREHIRAISATTPVFIVKDYSISLYGNAFAALAEL